MKRTACILILLACFLPGHASQKETQVVTTADATAPQGATAKCRDGSYSFSAHHRGSCSHHGGVDSWIQQAPQTSEKHAREGNGTTGTIQAKEATRDATGVPTGEPTPTGKPIYEGPKGGKYHISKNGKKVYEKKSPKSSSPHSHHTH